MKNEQLEAMIDLSRRIPEVKTMIAVFCDHHGATSVAHLYDLDREAFGELLEAATEMNEQLGDV